MKKTKLLWPCIVTIKGTMPNGQTRKICVKFDTDTGDDPNPGTHELACRALEKRMRKPSLWLGVGFVVNMPFGRTCIGSYEQNRSFTTMKAG